MADVNEHCYALLASIIPDRRDLLDKAIQQLNPDHFLDLRLKSMFQLLCRYADATGTIMPRHVLGDMFRNSTTVDAGKQALYEELYDDLAAKTDNGDFPWVLGQIRDLSAERATVAALAESMTILRTGRSDARGNVIQGHTAARTHALEEFAAIDRNLSMQDAPEGDMTREGDEMMQDYADRAALKSLGKFQGIRFGIPVLDDKIGGLQNGELDLIAAFSSDGKTSLAVQIAWSACVEQGKNVVFLTTETLRQQVRRKLMSRHSMHPLFNIPGGLNSRDLKNGTLDEVKQSRYQDVVRDFTTNTTYGHCYIAQVPRGASIGTCEARLYRIERMWPVDFVVIDYLRLLRSERSRGSDREELGSIIIEAKQLATTFADGRGVPILSPWQVNRAARDLASRTNGYNTSSLSETSESTNTADVIVSILAPDERERECDIKAQLLKNRDGETAASIQLHVDYATSTFTGARQVGIEDLMALAPSPMMLG